MADATDTDVVHWKVVVAGGEERSRKDLQRLLLTGSDRAYSFVECSTLLEAPSAARASVSGVDCVLLIDSPTSGGVLEVMSELPDRAPWPIVVCTWVPTRQRFHTLLRAGVPDVIAGATATPETLTRSVEIAVERFATHSLLRERDLSLQLAVEAAGVGLWTWDVGTDAVTWSPEVYRMLGIEESTLQPSGKQFFALIHDDDRARVEAEVRSASREGRPYQAEFRLNKPNGDVIWIENRGRAVYDDAGVPLRMLGTAADITDRKRQEDARKKSDAFARSVVEAAADCVAGFSLTGRLLWVNSHGKRILSAAAPTLASWWDLWNDEDTRAEAGAALAVATAGGVGRFTGRLKLKDDQPRWLDVVLSPISSGGTESSTEQLLCVARDITDARRAEDARLQAQTLMQGMLDGTPALVFAKDLQGRYFLANRAWRKFVGVEDSPIDGLTDDVLFPEDVARVLRDHDRQALGSDVPLMFEEWTTVGDQTVTYVSSKFALLDDSGQAYAVCGISSDITSLKEAQRTLAHRERELQTLADNSPDIIVRFDRQLRHVFISAAVTAATGRPREEFLGKTNRELGMPEPLCELWDRALNQVFRTAEPAEIKFDFQKDGQQRRFSARLTPEHDERGNVERVLCITRDRTQEHEHEQALRDDARRKDQFLATLAHELRNPLAPLRAGFDVLRQSPDRAQRERAQTMMRRQLDHMVRLVDDLLDVSRISRGRIELRRERVLLSGILNMALEACRPALDEGRHNVEVNLPNEPVWLDADSTRLAQVLGNLLNNAAKYTPDGGHITVVAETGPSHVRVRVSDDGIGIGRDMLPRVFDLFAQADHSLNRAQGGLGIGLSLVKNLVELHGGTVTADSAGLGFGSSFVIELPLDLSQPEATTAAAEPQRPAVQARRIMVVDDNIDGAEMLSMMLELAGHDVRCAHDGPSALALAGEFLPGVVFLDIGLPDMDGYEVARGLRADPRTQKAMLVALTGWGSAEDRRKARDAGFDFHLTKPVDLDAVSQLLEAR